MVPARMALWRATGSRSAFLMKGEECRPAGYGVYQMGEV